jgi:hypothetical protein
MPEGDFAGFATGKATCYLGMSPSTPGGALHKYRFVHNNLRVCTKTLPPPRVSADKGYSSKANHDAIVKHGATPFVMFKKNSGDNSRSCKGRKSESGAWEKMFHYFSFKRESFLAHYHKRSNVESTFSMIKAKFGDAVRSKTTTAMKNEALCKILCHNISCLISAMYELGIDPTLGAN